ncbi:MAG: hypothetical protein U0768_06590 [Anaerolineae bacterium]
MLRVRWAVAFAATLAVLAVGSRPTDAQFNYRYFQYLPTIARTPQGAPPAPTISAGRVQWNLIQLTWNAVPGAKAYHLWQSTNPSMAGAVTIYSGSAAPVNVTLPIGNFYFTVQAANDFGRQVSNVVGVPVVAPPPPPPPPPPDYCTAISGASYGSLSINGGPTDRPAENHADLNLALRGYEPTTAPLRLVDYGGASDSRAPQLPALFLDGRTPTFTSAYKVYDWDWDTNSRGGLIGAWPVTLLGMATSPGEVIRAPDSGYDIGQGYEVLVLYASETRLTLKYTREDNVVQGYTVHLESVCPEPSLLALYRQLNNQGRGRLPALRGGQTLGRANGGEIRAAVRDSGTFMDPRSRKDWWIGRLTNLERLLRLQLAP